MIQPSTSFIITAGWELVPKLQFRRCDPLAASGEGVRGAHREEGDHPRRGPQLGQRLRRQRRIQGSENAACPCRQGSLSEGNCQVSDI